MIPPSTFAESERRLYGRLMALSGVSYGLAAIAGASVIIWGAWPAGLAHLRLLLIGGALGGAIVGSISVTIALAVGGPVGRFHVNASKDGVGIEADGGDNA